MLAVLSLEAAPVLQLVVIIVSESQHVIAANSIRMVLTPTGYTYFCEEILCSIIQCFRDVQVQVSIAHIEREQDYRKLLNELCFVHFTCIFHIVCTENKIGHNFKPKILRKKVVLK